MTRSGVMLREVRPDDAPELAVLWQDVVPRGTTEQVLADIEQVVEQSLARDSDRIVVAECDGRLAGAVYLRTAPMGPLHLEPVVQAVSPHVLSEFRRHGIGRALMDAAVGEAEAKGVGHVASASVSSSREAHRFLARLALAPQAIIRLAPTHVVRAKLTAQRPSAQAPRHRPQLGAVLAARRSLRRTRDPV